MSEEERITFPPALVSVNYFLMTAGLVLIRLGLFRRDFDDRLSYIL